MRSANYCHDGHAYGRPSKRPPQTFVFKQHRRQLSGECAAYPEQSSNGGENGFTASALSARQGAHRDREPFREGDAENNSKYTANHRLEHILSSQPAP